MSSVIVQKNTTTVIVSGSRGGVASSACCGTTDVVEIGTPGPPGRDGRDAAGTLSPVSFNWGDAPRTVFTAPEDGFLTVARLQMTTAFNDPAATIIAGTVGAPEAVMPAAWNVPASTWEFETAPDLPLAAGESIILTIHPGTSTTGAGLLFLTFIPAE